MEGPVTDLWSEALWIPTFASEVPRTRINPIFSQDMPVVYNLYKSHPGKFFMVAAYACSSIRLEFCEMHNNALQGV